MLPFVFEDGFGFERYADYMLDVPMYFVYRDGKYIDASGQSFRDFLEGQAAGAAGRAADAQRLGRSHHHGLPRGAAEALPRDARRRLAGRWAALNALPALWVGLLYDQTALDAAWDLVKDWTHRGPRLPARRDARRPGLATMFRGRRCRNWRARWSRSPMPACARASGSMRTATTRRSTWRRSTARWQRPRAGRRAAGQVARRMGGRLRAAVPRLRLLR